MKKINSLLLVFFTGTMLAFAQKHEPVNPQKDKLEHEGYTIRLLPAPGGTYGFDIRKGNELIVHQSYHPFTLSPIGLTKKEDVYKVAKWQIKNLKANGKPGTVNTPGNALPGQPKLPTSLQERLVKKPGMNRPFINQPLPKSAAKELQINIGTGTGYKGKGTKQ